MDLDKLNQLFMANPPVYDCYDIGGVANSVYTVGKHLADGVVISGELTFMA